VTTHERSPSRWLADVLLAFDTATPSTVVAVATDHGSLVCERRHDPMAGERPGHTTELLPLAEAALAEAGCDWSAVGRLGVGVGPGGFTGLRVGLATGRALAGALGVDTVPLLSLDALATSRGDTPLVSIIDARRGEVFFRRYEEALSEPAVIEPAALRGTGETAVGDGAVRYRDVLADAGFLVPDDDDPRHLVPGLGLARLTATQAPGPLLPVYLREPDAQPRHA